MTTNTRTFLRDFSTIKAKARKGEVVRVVDKEGEFLFTASSSRKTLMNAAKGKISITSDLTRPTLPPSAWKASV